MKSWFSINDREVHHMCVLLGYGADAICPYLIFDAAQRLRDEGILNSNHTDEDIFQVKSSLRILLLYYI